MLGNWISAFRDSDGKQHYPFFYEKIQNAIFVNPKHTNPSENRKPFINNMQVMTSL